MRVLAPGSKGPSMRRQDTVHLIKRQSRTLSYTEMLSNHRTKHYAVGVPSIELARRIQYTIDDEPCLRLYRASSINITKEVNNGLKAYGVDQTDGDIVIDTKAKLHIPKCVIHGPLHPLESCMFHLISMPIEEFLAYPFDRNMGIIIPYDIESESDSELIVISTVVECAESIDSFRSSLSM